MGRIRVLGEDLVSLISAGEVIDNPSSVVKELVENSLDAGATQIEVSILRGGIDEITVSDNGVGILKEDCPLCLLRHSTSKIATKEDIDAIATYGFRGEALASIAAIADVKIISRAAGQEIGTVVVSRINEGVRMSDSSRATGTTVEVNDLFRHVPARRKHLGTPQREAQRILDALMRHAVIRYDVGFRMIRDGISLIDCPPNQTALDRIVLLWGREVAKKLVDVSYTKNDIEIRGFVVRPPVSRGNRSREYLSVLGRPIEDARLSLAVEGAYSTTLMKGRFPLFAIDIALSPSKVDANVHPTKREVRIEDLESIAAVLTEVVRNALQTKGTPEGAPRLQDFVEVRSAASDTPETIPIPVDVANTEVTTEFIEQLDLGYLSPETEIADTESLGGLFRIVGQIHQLYILLEIEDGLLIVDQHAAHERVLYERLREQVNSGTVASQELLEPVVVSLDSTDYERIMEVAEILESIGYSISSFGGKEVLVSAVPEILGEKATKGELLALVDRMVEIGVGEASAAFMDELVKVTACHSAIRSGQTLRIEEIRKLLADLYQTKSKHHCCHGRPSMLKITKLSMDKAVGRLGPEAIARYNARHGIRK
ncbi:MAG: DNA mismatch repair endonuclease MutL [Candidatus Thorarchaeota archaeon]|nr:DNA mismatch repair endonuclease MutL [Candidatus Thorarchaeota archaeon]